jgi:CSLREA domain-containing protein/uncharacterized repeat protein (TIGR01451 family)
LFLVVGVLILVAPSEASSLLTVTTTSDTVANDGLCSLREAIIASNTDAASGDVPGECPAGIGADTIDLSSLAQPATFVLTKGGPGEDNADTGDLDVVGALTISGAGAGITILDGNGQDRVFEIRPGAHVTITGMTIRNGDSGADVGGGIKVLGTLTISDSRVESNHGDGIRNQGGSLILNATDVISNTGGYGVYSSQGALSYSAGLVGGNQGGGVYSAASFTTLNDLSILYNSGSGVRNTGATLSHLTMHHCVVMSNTATSGAGIYNEGVGAVATVYDTRISGNKASAPGGGLLNNGLMTLSRSTIDHNRARSGGGIDHVGGNLSLVNDTFSGNQAADNGGGLYNRGTAVLTNVTFDDNTASGPDTGGNIFNDTASLSIVNTIVAYSDGDGNCFNSEGSIHSLGHNLESADTCGLSATGDLTNTDPLLGPLQDNGGPTWTHALLPGSPAIGAGDNSACPDTDQRGVPRPQGTTCDIGAYEAADTADLSIGKQRQGTGVVVAGKRITYTLTVTNAGPAAPITATVIDTWTPVTAIVGVEAPGCSVNLGGGVITCTRSNIGLGSVLLPDPGVVFTTDAGYQGTLTNVATVTITGGIVDTNLANNVSEPVVVALMPNDSHPVYLPIVLNGP